jgi:hypothetical protein
MHAKLFGEKNRAEDNKADWMMMAVSNAVKKEHCASMSDQPAQTRDPVLGVTVTPQAVAHLLWSARERGLLQSRQPQVQNEHSCL